MDTHRFAFLATRAIAVTGLALWAPVLLRGAQAASGPAEPAADGNDDAAYRKIIKDGVAEYEAHRFEEARNLFRRAHRISPNARTFRGIGMTSFELRDYVSAFRNLSAALRDQRKPLSAEQRQETQDLLDRSGLFVGVYTLTASPHRARVTIDGHTPEFEHDGKLLFGFGRHSLEASAQGMATRSLLIDVRGGERTNLLLTLEPVSAAGTRSESGKTDPVAIATQSPANELPKRHPEAWLWASAGAALAAGGAAAYWHLEDSELRACRNPSQSFHCTNESTVRTMWYTGLSATIAAGAAALTMAVVGILTWSSGSAAAKKHSALDCTASPLGVACGGPF